MRVLSTVFILCLYFISALAAANEELIPYKIIHDPFAMPIMQKKPVLGNEGANSEDKKLTKALKLFSTLRSGRRSMANVSGRILKIGEKIEGYKLIEVYERSVILIKNQQRTRLTLDDTDE
jgi:hypothetical protein